MRKLCACFRQNLAVFIFTTSRTRDIWHFLAEHELYLSEGINN